MGGVMSSVTISGDTSGSIILQAPSVAGSTTLTLPTTSGTVLTSANSFSAGTGPAFSAYANSGTSVSNATWTKILFQVEEFDTNSNFASSRFTPTVAGYYQLNASWQSGSNNSFAGTAFYKNGSLYQYGTFTPATSVGTQAGASALIYFNGSTDYVEIYVYQATGGTITSSFATSPLTWFSGSMARSA